MSFMQLALEFVRAANSEITNPVYIHFLKELDGQGTDSVKLKSVRLHWDILSHA